MINYSQQDKSNNICQTCLKPFAKDQIRRKQSYCSISCFGKSSKGKERTEAHRQKIREALTGREQTEQHKYNAVLGRKGYKHSEETKKKIGKANKGKKRSQEARLKISKLQKGKKLTKEHIQKRTESRKGYRHSNSTRQKIGSANKGTKHSQKFREDCARRMLGKKLSVQTKQKIIKGIADYFKGNLSSIEIAMQEVLDNLNTNYISQHPIGWYIVDFYLPEQNLIVECDGDYWHNRSGVQERDAKRDSYLRRKGYKVVRIWEHEIKKDANKAFRDATSWEKN